MELSGPKINKRVKNEAVKNEHLEKGYFVLFYEKSWVYADLTCLKWVSKELQNEWFYVKLAKKWPHVDGAVATIFFFSWIFLEAGIKKIIIYSHIFLHSFFGCHLQLYMKYILNIKYPTLTNYYYLSITEKKNKAIKMAIPYTSYTHHSPIVQTKVILMHSFITMNTYCWKFGAFVILRNGI